MCSIVMIMTAGMEYKNVATKRGAKKSGTTNKRLSFTYCMILTRNKILELISQGRFKIDPLYPDTVRENGLDLRIGGEYAIYAYEGVVIKPCELEDAKHLFRIVRTK